MKELENGLKVYNVRELEKIKGLKPANSDFGYIYILRYTNENTDNEIIKIGVSKNPYSRISSLIRAVDNYSFAHIEDFSLTTPHRNYYENESILHRYYGEYRKDRSELFNVDFNIACEEIYNIITLDTTDSSGKNIKNSELEEYNNDYFMQEEDDGCYYTKMEKELSVKIAKDCGLACMAMYNIILGYKINDNPHSCFPSYEMLMRDCNIGSKSTLTSNLSKLVEFGYLKIKSGNKGSMNTYYFPLADIGITNYREKDFEYINNIKRKVGIKTQTTSENSLSNLKNYTKKGNNQCSIIN